MTDYIMNPYKKTSPKKVLLSLLSTASAYQDNIIEEPGLKIDGKIADKKNSKQMEDLMRSEALARKNYEDKIDKLNEIVEINMNVLKDVELLASEMDEKDEAREKRFREKIDKENVALKQIEKYMVDLDELVQEIDTKIEDMEHEFQWELDDIKRLIEKELRKALLELKKDHKGDFRNILCRWVWKQIIIRINGFEIKGVLTEVSLEHIILVVSEDILIIPIKKIDFVKRHA